MGLLAQAQSIVEQGEQAERRGCAVLLPSAHDELERAANAGAKSLAGLGQGTLRRRMSANRMVLLSGAHLPHARSLAALSQVPPGGRGRFSHAYSQRHATQGLVPACPLARRSARFNHEADVHKLSVGARNVFPHVISPPPPPSESARPRPRQVHDTPASSRFLPCTACWPFWPWCAASSTSEVADRQKNLANCCRR